MVYLDYSATTPANEEVLDSFINCTRRYIGNPNSLHKLGVDSNHLINSCTKQIKELLHIDHDVIYTSGASESNNLAIKGIALKYQNRGKNIITTRLEHSSIYGPLEYLERLGFNIKYVNLTNDGLVDISHLKELMDNETILVSINAVNSEIGIKQPIDEIGLIINNYPKCYFHVDMTQAIGKINIPLDNVDLASFSSHKFYGIKGIGVLLKKNKIELEPLIHGGKSTTNYRSGTPTVSLIVSLAKSLRLALEDIDNKYNYIKDLNKDIKEYLSSYDKVCINSNDNSIPHILNISILGVKPESMLHALEEDLVYVSTKSACSKINNYSEAVYFVTNNEERAKSSIRISLSHLTAKEEIEIFKSVFDKCYKRFICLR